MRLLAIVAILGLIAAPMRAQAQCSEILEHGLYNTYQSLKTNDLKSAMAQGLCQSSENTSSGGQGGGGGLTIPIYGVPIGISGNYETSQAESIKNSSCQNGQTSLSDQNYLSLLSLTVDPEIVKAWSACQQQGGLYIDGILNGSQLIVEFRFRPMGILSQSRFVDNPTITGADCSQFPKTGDTINNVSHQYLCYRHGTDAVTILANDDSSGAAQFLIPAVISAPPLAPVIPTQMTCRYVPVANASPLSLPPPTCTGTGALGQPCTCPGVYGGLAYITAK
ncbi:hypothetical protein [Lichenicoccus roseus]|uniref:Uncharacterized protein n=1 Tax=Lichenicoccus roseus TaxID=2683649 RepID=A0A5R9J8W5_9PROT|nr:hypothetical protein [Lichenicoccus roseus]TLU70658.1 hypothetical protein FE263_20935 [Lichenicoccus roseus]